jgi:uncharacterized protein (UPF0212 family)
MNEANTH